MNKINISVIMAVYNAEKYVGEAILSVLNQSYEILS
jgi:glycosyltransferase involved in cell wall biosynthesis